MANSQSATQDFVSVRDIKEGVVIQKNGQMCMILLASSINFALKSADEQQAILQQFQHFLNTLDFTLQIYIQSRRLNIEPYIAFLGQLEDKQDNELMRIQLSEYMRFIQTFTTSVDVMTKSFFVVVPYSPTKINITKGFTNIFSPAVKTSKTPADAQFEEHRIQLEQRASVVIEGLARVGVRTIVLQNDDLVELFYHAYNPADTTSSPLPVGSEPIQ